MALGRARASILVEVGLRGSQAISRYSEARRARYRVKPRALGEPLRRSPWAKEAAVDIDIHRRAALTHTHTMDERWREMQAMAIYMLISHWVRLCCLHSPNLSLKGPRAVCSAGAEPVQGRPPHLLFSAARKNSSLRAATQNLPTYPAG